jgi:hypothetical protein
MSQVANRIVRVALFCCLVTLFTSACRSGTREAPPPPSAEEVSPAPAAAPVSEGQGLPLEMDVPFTRETAVGGVLTQVAVKSPGGKYVVTINARGTPCAAPGEEEAPIIVLKVNNVEVHRFTVGSSRFVDMTSPVLELAAGKHAVAVEFINDYYENEDCDRNAWVSRLSIVPPAP